MPKSDHPRVTPEGRALGRQSAAMAELGGMRLQALGLGDVRAPMLRESLCTTCACRPGSVPNGCLQTQMDFLKSVVEGKPFLCHAPHDGKLCAGWVRARAEVAARPIPPETVALLARWDYSRPDSDR